MQARRNKEFTANLYQKKMSTIPSSSFKPETFPFIFHTPIQKTGNRIDDMRMSGSSAIRIN